MLRGARRSRRRGATGEPPLPTFLVLGAQKSGTRWLRENLDRHPDAFVVPTEINFFNRNYHKGLDAYRNAFAGWAGEAAVGDCTPGYMMWRKDCEELPDRIAGSLPDVRLLAILRDPVERAYSAFIHHMSRQRFAPDAELIETVRRCAPEDDQWSLISGGWYGRSLEPYVRRFGDRLLVVFTDQVSHDPGAVYRDALAHVGVDPDFVPPKLDRVRYSTRPPRGSSVTSGSRRRRGLTVEERAVLFEYFDEDVRRLEDLIGSDLSRWKPSTTNEGYLGNR